MVANGRRVELTVQEFRLLQYLTENPGRRCSRRELYANVWHRPPRPRDLAVVDDYVKRLGAKIGTRLIDGDPDAGYSLSAGIES